MTRAFSLLLASTPIFFLTSAFASSECEVRMGSAISVVTREEDDRELPRFSRAWKFASHEGESVGQYAFLDEDTIPLFRSVKRESLTGSNDRVGATYSFVPAQALESSSPLTDDREDVYVAWQVIGEDGLRYPSRSTTGVNASPTGGVTYPELSSGSALDDLVSSNLVKVPFKREKIIGIISKGAFRLLLDQLESQNQAQELEGYTVSELLFAISQSAHCRVN